MKTDKINIWWLCLLLITTMWLSSCESNIDLESKGIISQESYFKSEEDYINTLHSLYNRLYHDNYGFWLDAVSDDAIVTQEWNWGYDIARGRGNSQSNFSQEIWERMYISIQRANNVVNNIDRYDWPGGEANATRNKILGEARTLRCYFYLNHLCLYGRIMFYDVNPATVEESRQLEQVENPKVVFDFILDDLEKAINELPEKPENKSRIAKPAAQLLRARAAAYAAGYLSDKTYFQVTLTETAAMLASAPALGDYSKLFGDNNESVDEIILVKSYSEDQKNSWGNWYNQSIAGYCVNTPVKALVDAYEYIETPVALLPYENKDPRFYVNIYAPGAEIRGKYYNTIPENVVERDGKTYFDPAKEYGHLQDKEVLVGDALGEGGGGEWNKTLSGFTWKKYFALEDTWNTWNTFVIFRYAEAYLLRAEALAETGGSTEEAKALIQIIRDRAGNTNNIDRMISEKYGTLLELIRNERRVEMACEGLRLYDIRRWKIVLDVMNKPVEGIEYIAYTDEGPKETTYIAAQRSEFTEKHYWWPISQKEIDLNLGRITQNQGW